MFSKIFPKIHSEGYKFLVIAGIITIVLYSFSDFLGLIGFVLTIWVYYFFRDPERISINDENYLKILPENFEISIVHNFDYENGMFSSVQKGVENLDGDCFIIPGDYPLINKDTYYETLRQKGEIRVPVYKGKKGHPIFLEKAVVKKLKLEPTESNLKAFRNKYQDFGGDGIYAPWKLTYQEPFYKKLMLHLFHLILLAHLHNVQVLQS